MPATLVATISAAGPAGQRWIARLPALVEETCGRWDLVVDGETMHGRVSLVLPVRRVGGGQAILKVGWPHPEAAPEAAALRAWDGCGAVRLLDHDPELWLLLLEPLDPIHDLDSLDDIEAACDLAASLLPVLHGVEPPPEIPLLADRARDWEERLLPCWEAAHPPFPRRRAEEARELAEALPAEGGLRLLHGDLHLANVLSGPEERGGWLAIDPKPLAGDPASETLALLRNRPEVWAAASDPAGAIRSRLRRICHFGGLDLDRVGQGGGATLGEGGVDVVDLEVVAGVAAGDHAGGVAGFDRSAQGCGDVAAFAGDDGDVVGSGEQHLEH